MKNFWQQFKQPIFALAPMDDVTDTVFRQIVASCGKPDIFFTEFVNVDGICSKGFDKFLETRLKFSQKEKPLIAQIWGNKPENFYESAKILKKMGFDGIDINMGCPIKDVVRTGGGGALTRDLVLAKEIILATKKGAGDLPVSVKTRIGFDKIITEEWIGFLLNLDLAAIAVHGRTVKEMSKVPTHWDEIGKAIKIRGSLKSKTVILGNGDIKSYQEGLEKCQEFKLDGVMIGRGVFENIWIFDKDIDIQKVTPEKRIKVLLSHLKLFDKTYGKSKNFNTMKKFFKAYVRDFDGASELRAKLMELSSTKDVEKLLKGI